MKNISLMLMICFTGVGISVSGQNNNYYETMLGTIESLQEASGDEDYLSLSNKFERIAKAEKSKWLPYYYSAYAAIIMSYNETDMPQRDLILNRAQRMLDSAFVLTLEESELHVLQAFLYPSRILVDPIGRGMMYMEKCFVSLETAKALDPDNPRTYFLMGINKLNMPPSMGGGPDVAKPLFIEAKEKFIIFQATSNLSPDWGEEVNNAELKKLM